MTDDRDEAPDRVHRWTPTRRQALALGTGAMGGLAGCSELSENFSGSDEPADQTPTETVSLSEAVEASADFSIDGVVLELRMNLYSYAKDSLSGTLRLYSAPNLDRSNQTVLAEKSIDQTDEIAEYTFEPDFDLGYAQHLQFTIETDNSEEAGEQPIYTPDETIVPFYNAARDTEMVLVEPPSRPQDDWAYSDPFYQTQFWFSSPDDSGFNTPSVPDGEYDQDWYEHQNITITALIRFPTYEDIKDVSEEDESEFHSPLFEWAVVNISLDAWELLEATRWNSIATQKLESREYSYGEDGAQVVNSLEDYGSNNETTNKFNMDASSGQIPYVSYAKLRYAGVRWDESSVNPLLMNSGRPISYRIANEFESALDNPSFNTLEYTEYHKAIALQVFIGQNQYGFTTGEYVKTPEEVLKNWYYISTGQKDSAGFCQDASAMYGGIAIHLLDSTNGILGMQGTVGYHILGGLINLRKPSAPYEIWPDHPSPTAAEEFTLDTEYGTVSTIECTYPDPTIGWRNQDSSDYELLTYLSNTSLQSHMPINNEYEPDEGATAQTEYDDPEIPWEVHTRLTVVDDIENFSAS